MSKFLKYKISTINDLRSVPADRLGTCLQAIAEAVVLTNEFDPTGSRVIEEFVWIDDGRNDETVRVVVA